MGGGNHAVFADIYLFVVVIGKRVFLSLSVIRDASASKVLSRTIKQRFINFIFS